MTTCLSTQGVVQASAAAATLAATSACAFKLPSCNAVLSSVSYSEGTTCQPPLATSVGLPEDGPAEQQHELLMCTKHNSYTYRHRKARGRAHSKRRAEQGVCVIEAH